MHVHVIQTYSLVFTPIFCHPGTVQVYSSQKVKKPAVAGSQTQDSWLKSKPARALNSHFSTCYPIEMSLFPAKARIS